MYSTSYLENVADIAGVYPQNEEHERDAPEKIQKWPPRK